MKLLRDDFLDILNSSEKRKSVKRVGLDYPISSRDAILPLFDLSFRQVSAVSVLSCNRYETLHLVKAVEGSLQNLQLLSEIQAAQNIVIKPALIESRNADEHSTTNPALLRQLILTLKSLVRPGTEIIVVEGSGHERDSEWLLWKTGIAGVIADLDIRFVDLNHDDLAVLQVPNPLSFENLILPRTIVDADFIVSVASMKTHFRTAVSLGMKNLFGCVPGSVYGFPKNKLHWASISRVIADLASIVKPKLTLIDGITAIEGNGPLDGVKRNCNILISGRDVATTDLVASKIMGFSPGLIPKFWYASEKGLIQSPELSGLSILECQQIFKAPQNIKWIEGTDLMSKKEQLQLLDALLAEGNS